MELTIKKSELKRIYDIACENWKSKIEDCAKRDLFSDTITFTNKEVDHMLRASTDEQLPIVKEVFQIKDSYENIKTLEDACNYLGEKDDEVQTLRALQGVVGLSRHVVAEQELIVVVKALNEKHVFDWSTSNEDKWFNWFYLNDFRFRNSYYCNTGSSCSARLCFKSKELAEYCASQFENLYKEYLTK